MAGMEYRKIRYVDKKVSRIFFGTAFGAFMMGSDCTELLSAVYSTGVNAFDCARGYGLAEKSLGEWMTKCGNREDIVLLTKCGHPSPYGRKRVREADVRKDLQKSLQYLQTDYIDIYLLHRDDPDVDIGEIVELFNALHTEGSIRAFGGSNWTVERVQAANEYAYKHNLIPFTVSSPNFGLAEQVRDPWGGGCVTVSGPKNAYAREWYAKEQMPVIAYSSLGRGLFSGRLQSRDADRAAEYLDNVAMKGYGCPENFERLRRCEVIAEEKGCTVAQVAMAWIYGQEMNTFAVVSTSSAERMRQNIEAISLGLTESELQYLDLLKEER